ncbi:HAD family phosphatase [uncultured Alistipes sp.]|uniref:HAD family hydrolase n=1 Tax=uncultured Alistipes sp. TaxID=538949 RepID=UPI002612DE27|nr:HAD family phosphatase [uncultured Alistipes sp.]
MQQIKNVIFDLGGVLVDLDIERCIAAFRLLGMNRVADLVNPYYPAEMIGRLERGDISFHEACDEMRRLDNRPGVSDAEIAGAYGAFLTGIPVAKLRQIARLREAGIRTYVLSNNNPASMEVIRGQFTADGRTMDDYFDKIYLSYELRELKPSEAIFRKVMADSGVVPAQTLFIDDGQKNVDTAQALGFAVYMPAPEEDFGHLFDEITRTK